MKKSRSKVNQCNSFCLLFIVWVLFPVTLGFTKSGVKYYFEQGNQAYRQGNYQTAIQWYEKILNAGYESGTVYYNLGNCYYKMDQIGLAILYYEKARKLRPDDAELKFNLELANLKVIDRIELPPRFFLFEWWDAIKYYYTIPELTRLVLGLYLLVMSLFITSLFIKRDRLRRTFWFFLVMGGLLTIFWVYILFLNVREERHNLKAVILSPTVTVQSAPEEESTDVFILHEGVKVRLVEQRGEWVKISLPDGKSGWLKRGDLGVI